MYTPEPVIGRFAEDSYMPFPPIYTFLLERFIICVSNDESWELLAALSVSIMETKSPDRILSLSSNPLKALTIG